MNDSFSPSYSNGPRPRSTDYSLSYAPVAGYEQDQRFYNPAYEFQSRPYMPDAATTLDRATSSSSYQSNRIGDSPTVPFGNDRPFPPSVEQTFHQRERKTYNPRSGPPANDRRKRSSRNTFKSSPRSALQSDYYRPMTGFSDEYPPYSGYAQEYPQEYAKGYPQEYRQDYPPNYPQDFPKKYPQDYPQDFSPEYSQDYSPTYSGSFSRDYSPLYPPPTFSQSPYLNYSSFPPRTRPANRSTNRASNRNTNRNTNRYADPPFPSPHLNDWGFFPREERAVSEYPTMQLPRHDSRPEEEKSRGFAHYPLIRQLVGEANKQRRSGNVEGARQVLESLVEKYPLCHIVWMEWSRLEMDLGNVTRSREVVLRGLEVLPGNEALLEKRVKIEERLRNYRGVVDCALQFLDTNSSRCVKNVVEAAVVVAKLGYGYQAIRLFDALMERNLVTQGSVTLDYIRFIFKTEDYQKGLSLLKKTLEKLTKHSPIWFFTFSVLEQDYTVYWKCGDISARSRNQELTDHLNQALKCLPDDLRWKVYYIAAQAQLRSFTHIRLWTRMKKRYLREYCSEYPHVVRVCFEFLKSCVSLCSEDYQWKVWLLAGRVLALAGHRTSALKVGLRGRSHVVSRPQYGDGSRSQHARGVSRAGAHSRLHRTTGGGRQRHRGESAPLPRRVEAGAGADPAVRSREGEDSPTAPQRRHAGGVHAERGVAHAPHDGGTTVVVGDPADASVSAAERIHAKNVRCGEGAGNVSLRAAARPQEWRGVV